MHSLAQQLYPLEFHFQQQAFFLAHGEFFEAKYEWQASRAARFNLTQNESAISFTTYFCKYFCPVRNAF